MGTPRWLQHLVFVMDGAVVFMAVETVLEAVYICDVGAGPGFELGELVGGEGCSVKQSVEE